MDVGQIILPEIGLTPVRDQGIIAQIKRVGAEPSRIQRATGQTAGNLAVSFYNCLPDEYQVMLAKSIATQAHAGQFDRGGDPYVMHPEWVANKVRELGGGEIAVAAAWLHDVIEDAGLTAEDLLKMGVSPEVVKVVVLLTRKDGMSVEEYLDKIRSIRDSGNPDAILVKFADMSHNRIEERLKPFKLHKQERKLDRYTQGIGIILGQIP